MYKLITKSKYLIGLQCYKYLWISVNKPDKIPEVDEETQYRFDQGHLVGELAKKLWQNGKSIATENFRVNLKESNTALSLRIPLFEAGILADNVFARTDVLEPTDEDDWNIIEVKSATKLKDNYIEDVAFQKYCCEKRALKIKKCFLFHVNGTYVKNGEVNPEDFFVKNDITCKVNEIIQRTEGKINEMLKIVSEKNCPDIKIGKHCTDECPLQKMCWDFLPENNVFNLYRGRKMAFEMFEEGIVTIKDITDEYELQNKQQKIQYRCEKSGKHFVDKNAIREFIANLKYPLYFLDFETYNTVIPFYNGVKPYQNIPFQFSLHIVKEKFVKPVHYSYLTENAKDTRKEIVQKLEDWLGMEGNIVVYNETFEKRILNNFAEWFPEYKKWVDCTIQRITDLLLPFRNFSYYHPGQRGSASIKKVLSVLTDKNYDEMEINNGEAASLKFLHITFENANPDEKEVEKTRKALEEYCKLDTEGMILILDKLRKLVKIHEQMEIKY